MRANVAVTQDVTVLPPQVAGTHYPAHPDDLAEAIGRAIIAARTRPCTGAKIIVAPNGPLALAGEVTAAAFAGLAGRSEIIRRVVVVAPVHTTALRGMAVPTYGAFRTPLGDIPVDWMMMQRLKPFAEVVADDRPFTGEHAIEAVLPFLQVCLDRFELVPVLVGATQPHMVDAVLKALWGGPETLIVLSTNLGAGISRDSVRALDAETRMLVETLSGEAIGTRHAPGHRLLTAATLRARALDLRATGTDFRATADPDSPSGLVTGYGAFVFEPAMQAHLHIDERTHLLKLAARSLRTAARTGTDQAASAALGRLPATLNALRAVYVTLEQDKAPRGQAGTLSPTRGLAAETVLQAARAAVDPRFAKLSVSDLETLRLTLSVLSYPRLLAGKSDIEVLQRLIPGRTGLIVETNDRSFVQLPSVWAQIADPLMFVAAARQRIGCTSRDWRDGMRMRSFTCESFGGSVADLLGEG